ncbi:MAG TPA: hypothetical protein PLX23_11230 [Candidatus Hydrogenedens sp.]|nr:hypothetical protein [Candidatus Hydrogenedens sp.]
MNNKRENTDPFLDPVELFEKEVFDWEKYYGEIFIRFSQIIDRIKGKLPHFRMSLRNRKNLNAYLERLSDALAKALTQEEQIILIKGAQNQIREVRSALAHCYTTIVAFEDAFDKALALIERIPEDKVVSTNSSSLNSLGSIQEKKVSGKRLLEELQEIYSLIPEIDTVQIKKEYNEEMDENEAKVEKVRIGDILVKAGVITEEQLQKALIYQKQSGYKEHLGSILVRLGYIDDVALSHVFARQSGYPFIGNLQRETVHTGVLRIIPERLARQHDCMPLQIRGNTLRVAMANPYDLLAIEDLKLVSNCSLDIVVSTKVQIVSMIQKYYSYKY